jgi:DNA-binding winged helix-turn-helix (wHTH) protein
MPQLKRPPIRFGIFEVDLEAGELRRQGVKVKLQQQPFQILTLLLECPGEVVTRGRAPEEALAHGHFCRL